ncbi:conserved phage C-terminal domain-containing protein [Acerihabitans sp. TG2]|uniref:conserved phage C-terminal domain-containing protein n=1 Tax=Acerihabitans sp. TG2 TaxID=3096008 RepID=UPI002B22905F|nr:conserved phage C-terminal domain-containing protein [Acerihabitans sp. TG2]MEA9393145.1 conserved phage C-terminal domain-containing protein [Acerihabitans sp. TG2]
MSIKLMSQVWDVQSLTQPRKMLLLAVADFANDEGYSWPSVETLMRKCSFKSDSGVRRALAELAEAGWLSKTTRSVKAANGRRQQGSNAYQLNLVRLLAESLIEPVRRTPSKPFIQPVPYEGSQDEGSCHEGSPGEGSYNNENPHFEPVPGTADPLVNSTPDPSSKNTLGQPPAAAAQDGEFQSKIITDQAIRVLEHLNKLTGARYTKAKSTLQNIRARITEGNTVEELNMVVEYLVDRWLGTEWAKYLNPETMFRPSKFSGNLLAAQAWDNEGRKSKPQSTATTDNAEREAAYKRYFKLTLDNKSKSAAETAARKEADGASVKAMRADFAKTTWNKIWTECNQRLNGGKTA